MVLSIARFFRGVVVGAAVAAAAVAQAATLVSVFSGPQDGASDILRITDPVCCASGFALHDHVYLAPHLPDPARATVVFEFDVPVIVDSLTMIQHANGITKLEQLVGDSLAAMETTGTALSGVGDVTGSVVFAEGASDVFAWTTANAGRFHKFIVGKTSLADGYASYRWYLDVSPVPEAPSVAMLLAGLGLLAVCGARHQRSVRNASDSLSSSITT